MNDFTPSGRFLNRIMVFAGALILACTFHAFAADPADFYQIQVFKLNGKVQEAATDNFLKNAYLPALHRSGVKTIGVFKPIESDTTSGKRIYVWIPFKSLDQFSKIQESLLNDQEYQSKGNEFLGSPFNQAPFLRKASI